MIPPLRHLIFTSSSLQFRAWKVSSRVSFRTVLMTSKGFQIIEVPRGLHLGIKRFGKSPFEEHRRSNTVLAQDQSRSFRLTRHRTTILVCKSYLAF